MLLWGRISLASVLPGHVSQEEAGSYRVRLGLGASGCSGAQPGHHFAGGDTGSPLAGQSRCLVAGGVALDTQW